MRLSILLIVVTALSLSGCFEKGDCQNQTSNIVKVAFFNSSDQKVLKVQLDSVFIRGLEGKFIEDEELESIVIPLDPLSDEAVITLYRPEATNTITIGYIARTTVLDPACGATDLYLLKKASGEGISSATITQEIVSVSLTTNVSVYF
ncbi:MAG: hypothetical protein ACO3FI_03120 [Cyclobacteriaceae bacterium]